MNDRGTSSANIHGVLDYAISKALLEGIVGKTSLKVYLSDLVNFGEGINLASAGEDLVLKVQIETSWDVGPEELVSDFDKTEEEDDGPL